MINKITGKIKSMTKPGSRKGKYLLLLIPVAVLVFAAVELTSFAGDEEEIKISTAKISRGDIKVVMDSDASVEFETVEISSSVQGTVAEILAEEGDMVAEGDVIIRLEDESYQDEYRLAVANLEDSMDSDLNSLLSGELSLSKLEMELQDLEDELALMQAMPESYSAAELRQKEQETENKRTEYENTELKNEMLREQYEKYGTGETKMEIQAKMALEDLSDTVMYAPVDGVLVSLETMAGEIVKEEGLVAEVHNGLINAVSDVMEYDIGEIWEGQTAYLSLDALPDDEFTGVVSKIAILPTISSGIVNYEVEVAVEDEEGEIRDGMTGTLSFVKKEVNDVLIIPYEYVYVEDGVQYADVVAGESTEKREISTGFTDGTDVEIISGLEAGETVTVSSGGR